MKVLSKYLGVQSDRTAKEVAISAMLFYIIPTYILGLFIDLKVANYLSLKLGLMSLIVLYLFVGVLSLILFLFAALNIIVILDKDYKKNYSTSKKILYFFLMFIPYVLHANFFSIYLTKRSDKYKFKQLFAVSFVLIAILFTFLSYVTTDLVSLKLLKETNKQDRAPIINIETKSAPTAYKGVTYSLKKPFFIQLDLPRGIRFNSSSVIKAEGKLVDFKNSCSNCLDRQRLERPIKMKFLNVGSKLTVIDYFSYMEKRGKHEYIIVKDENGTTAEISLNQFEDDILKNDNKYEQQIKDLFDEIEIFKYSDKILCSRTSTDTSSLDLDGSISKFSNNIGGKIFQFIKDFALKDQIEIKSFSYAELNKKKCATVRIKSLNALALLIYYGEDWGISDDYYSLDSYDRIQSSEPIIVKHDDFINKTTEEIINQYP